MVVVRQQVQNLLSLPIFMVVTFLFVEVINGQPNFYYKASSPVKSLPRIGRRSGDVGAGNGDTGLLSSSNGGGGLGQNSMSIRSLDLAPGPPLEMWASADTYGGTLGSPNRPSLYASGQSGGSGISSLNAPSASQLEKSLFWRKLVGDINNYEEALFDNMYRSSKT